MQGYEDAVENLKIQFAAISEQKAEVEHKLEPLHAESRKLAKQVEEHENRKEERMVSPSYVCPIIGTPTPRTDAARATGRGAREGDQWR